MPGPVTLYRPGPPEAHEKGVHDDGTVQSL